MIRKLLPKLFRKEPSDKLVGRSSEVVTLHMRKLLDNGFREKGQDVFYDGPLSRQEADKLFNDLWTEAENEVRARG